jgi:N-acylneuraminate cytidylyltransferase
MSTKDESKIIVGIIPARGGSKGIHKKNIVDFCGKPLLAWTILQAKGSKYLDDVYVSTDDEEIAEVATKYGAKVIDRPDDISGDKSTSESAILHAVDKIESIGKEIQYVVFLQATSPLRESSDIDNAVQKIIDERADSLFSGVNIGDFYIWEKSGDNLESINYDYKNRKRRQDHNEQFGENGSIYIFTPEVLRKYNNRFGEKITISQMDFWKTFEVDDGDDLDFCSMIFRSKGLDKKYN